jgi:cell division transport system permease protein
LVFALVTMLIAIQSVTSLQHIIENYEKKIADEYALIVVAGEELRIENVRLLSHMIASLEPIDASRVVNEIKGNLTQNNEALLVASLPKFYRLKLIKYPSANELKKTVDALQRNNTILRVESFAKNQNTLYAVLLLNKTVLTIFSVLIFLIASLLVVRQMEVWRFRHSERMQIMAIFGAALWLRSAVLYRLAVIDSVVATCIVSGLFFFLSTDARTRNFLEEMGLGHIAFDLQDDALILFAVALGISVASVMYVIVKSDEEVR